MLVMVVYLVARLVSLGVGYFLVSSLSNIKISKINFGEIKKMWQMTWPMGVFLIMFATYDRAIDSLLIQNYIGAEAVAWYGLAYKIYGAMLAPAYFYVNSIFPMMGKKETNNKKLFTESSVIMAVSSLMAVLGIWLIAPLIIGILGGAAFGPSVGILRVLMVAAIFSYMGHLAGFTLISEGGQKEMLKLGVVALLTNLVLNIILIPRYGYLAAAWVTVLTEAIDCGLMMWFLKQQIK